MERDINLNAILDRLYLSAHRPLLQARAIQDIAGLMGAESITFALHDTNSNPVRAFSHPVFKSNCIDSPIKTRSARSNTFNIKIGVDRRFLNNGFPELQPADGDAEITECQLFLVLTFTGACIDETTPESTIELFETLSRHLGRALLLFCFLESDQSVKHSLFDVLEKSGQTVILVDEDLNVGFLGPAAGSCLVGDEEGPVRVANGCLMLEHKSDERRVKRAVCRCIYSQSGEGVEFLLGHNPRVQVTVLPSSHDSDQAATILIKKRQDGLRLCDKTLSSLCGLSQREVDFIKAFVESPNLTLVSRHLNISYETTRWHLKRVMTKLQVNSQAEMLSYVLSSCLLIE